MTGNLEYERPRGGILKALIEGRDLSRWGLVRRERPVPSKERERVMVHDILSPAGLPVGGDARAMMMFETNKRSLAVSYALWFLVGLLGGHRFYNRKFASAILQMISTLFGLLLTLVIVGWFFIGVIGIWVLIDVFLIPGWVKRYNSKLVEHISSGRLV
jgi:TM2 domain-containing membrane protein YozV